MITTVIPPVSRHGVREGTVPTRWLLRALLLCRALSSPLYVGVDVLARLRGDGYSFVEQMVSEELAIGAPTRRIWLALGPSASS